MKNLHYSIDIMQVISGLSHIFLGFYYFFGIFVVFVFSRFFVGLSCFFLSGETG